MNPLALGLVLGTFFALLVLAAWEWSRWVVSVYQWLLKQPAFSGLCLFPTGSLPGEGGHEISDREQPRLWPSSRTTSLSSPAPASSSADLESAVHRCDRSPTVDNATFNVFVIGLLAAVPLGTAMQPDFESFWGGFEAVIEPGGVVIVALGMILIARRYLRP
ncbi:MAG TPA: hypothetical protein VGC63_10260 [Solirubrobacterales bacterium]